MIQIKLECLKIEKNLMDINLLLEDVCDEANIILKDNIKFTYKVPNEEIYIKSLNEAK